MITIGGGGSTALLLMLLCTSERSRQMAVVAMGRLRRPVQRLLADVALRGRIERALFVGCEAHLSATA